MLPFVYFSLLQGHRLLIVSRLFFFFVSANGVLVWIPGKAQRNICILKDNTISARVIVSSVAQNLITGSRIPIGRFLWFPQIGHLSLCNATALAYTFTFMMIDPCFEIPYWCQKRRSPTLRMNEP